MSALKAEDAGLNGGGCHNLAIDHHLMYMTFVYTEDVLKISNS